MLHTHSLFTTYPQRNPIYTGLKRYLRQIASIIGCLKLSVGPPPGRQSRPSTAKRCYSLLFGFPVKVPFLNASLRTPKGVLASASAASLFVQQRYPFSGETLTVLKNCVLHMYYTCLK